MATQEQIRGHWNELRGRIEERWSQLSSNDLDGVDGNVDQLVGVLQQKTGQARTRIEAELNEMLGQFEESGSGGMEQMGEYAKEYARQAKDYVQHTADQAREQYRHLADDARRRYGEATDYVRERPTESLAVAFGTGLLAGVIVGLVLRSR
jgi:ElaB/YqjD/DUF883 family membrane-anchored ribosome-binding protein